MPAKSRQAVFSENVANNLEQVRLFLEPEGKNAFTRLLARFFDDIVSTVCQFPQSGRPLLAHSICSVEAQAMIKQIEALLKKGDGLREFVVEDYLILYLFRANQVIFLAIKHHRQLSFDFSLLWP
ncbi:MAG: type II toxin-antitoxin system RelE/ParE family toxin [Candidatus Tectomicrobia bacterium]|uniref:Type II toxin-antitoxin system RelE/ParE family toxin n=1 Tax=Tectimicrobiota bacterium TaxID=2528274 RepID=A0A932M0S9_UNCTE|nr:type II toxin-antitoxin system RelE/ParE family toxin [Candidatus Tectomicrobia bacterium]